jgi:uncharacterized protein with ParB-like and HNH nuclease domain
MNNAKLERKPIHKLMGEKFLIPPYQRGYRWTTKQVEFLLEDIWTFSKNKQKDDFYCLQPVVATKTQYKDEVRWELIDGQQRLTTIFIILDYFNKRFVEESRKELFGMIYKTRPESEAFLKNINKEEKDKNIDFFFIHNTSEVVKNWFNDKISYINDFESTLLNNTEIIWYEVENDEENLSLTDEEKENNSIEIFTRLNIGKIPLNSAELIKALFLQKSNFENEEMLKQLHIASEWDEIEKKLQNNHFWYFIFSSRSSIQYDNRIEYLFDLMKGKTAEDEDDFSFNKFIEDFENEKKINNHPDVSEQWLKIKNYFLRLEEWYNNHQLYHYIGFLIEYNYSISELMKKSEEKNKDEFLIYVKEKIKDKLRHISVEELEYANFKEVKMVLLLFNILTILSTQKAVVKFPFDKYKADKWDIEHVNSQTGKKIDNKNRKQWSLDLLQFFTGIEDKPENTSDKDFINRIIEKIEKLDEREKGFCNSLLKVYTSEKFDEVFTQTLYEKLSTEFKENIGIENTDGIYNLALLDENTNRSYGNAMFPVKRRRIIQNDSNGIFVPICTKNLFLKYYSKKVDGAMFWQQSDADNYLTEMMKILKPFLKD